MLIDSKCRNYCNILILYCCFDTIKFAIVIKSALMCIRSGTVKISVHDFQDPTIPTSRLSLISMLYYICIEFMTSPSQC